MTTTRHESTTLTASEIDLRNCAACDLAVASPTPFVHADHPWSYSNSGTRGSAANQYDTMSHAAIIADLNRAYVFATNNAYLALWCTFPKIGEWFKATEDKALCWRYVTGGAWGKQGGFGVGFHFAGDAELLLLYAKGFPRPRTGRKSNLWLAKRIGHSEKPANALEALVGMGTDPGDLVVELYAGASASMARVCRRLGRRYLGAELDPSRHRAALRVLAQGELFTDLI